MKDKYNLYEIVALMIEGDEAVVLSFVGLASLELFLLLRSSRAGSKRGPLNAIQRPNAGLRPMAVARWAGARFQ